MTKISASIPTRIDLAGGTLDLWPIHQLLDHKCTVNIGVTLNAEVTIERTDSGSFVLESLDQGMRDSGDFDGVSESRTLPLLGMLLKELWADKKDFISITTTARSPAGAGLGGSSCLGIAIAGALIEARRALKGEDLDFTEQRLVQTVQDIEARLIHAPTGCQDYWGGLRGNVNVLTFPPGQTVVETISANSIPEMNRNLVVAYSGKSRASAINNWEIFKKLFDGDKMLLDQFNKIGLAAEQCAMAIRDGDLERALFVSQQEWILRTQLWPNIETAETSRIDEAVKKAGASFSRVCGAGGGGVMAVFCQESVREQVKSSITESGGVVLDSSVAANGLQVTTQE